MLHHLSVLVALVATPAFACISFPKTVELKGSSFAAATNISFSGNCGAWMEMSLKSDDNYVQEQGTKISQERSAWFKTHPEPPFDSPAREGYYGDMSAMEKQLAAKYPLRAPSLSLRVSMLDGRLCVIRDKENCNSTLNKAITDEHGKTIGLLNVNPVRAVFYSVNDKGEKDLTKPAIVVRPDARKSLNVFSYDNRQLVGSLTIDGETCSKAINPPGKGVVELNGKALTTAGGCGGGGLVEKEFGKEPMSPELIPLKGAEGLQ